MSLSWVAASRLNIAVAASRATVAARRLCDPAEVLTEHPYLVGGGGMTSSLRDSQSDFLNVMVLIDIGCLRSMV